MAAAKITDAQMSEFGLAKWPAKGTRTVIRASAALTAIQVATSVVDCGRARWCTLEMQVDYAAAASYVHLVVMRSRELNEPSSALHESWIPISQAADISSDADLPAGLTVLPSITLSKPPDWAQRKIQPMQLVTQPAENATDLVKLDVRVNVEDARWLVVLACDPSGAGTLATMGMHAVCSA